MLDSHFRPYGPVENLVEIFGLWSGSCFFRRIDLLVKWHVIYKNQYAVRLFFGHTEVDTKSPASVKAQFYILAEAGLLMSKISS